MKHIVVAVRYSIPAGQYIWAGIQRYIAEQCCDWEVSFRRDAEEFTEQDVNLLSKTPPDGIICSMSHKLKEAQRAFSALAAMESVPIVAVRMHDFPDFGRRRKNIAFIEDDADAIGEIAAHHFLTQGTARSYAYVPTRDEDVWSVIRGEKFARALKRHGHGCRRYRPLRDPLKDQRALMKWLRGLPRPCGIFATYDSRGAEILSYLHGMGIKVPEEISVLGCANDKAVAPFTPPPLSSIVLPLEEQGYAAAEQLDDLIARRTPLSKPVFRTFAPQKIDVRESTSAVSYSGKLVQRALTLIRSGLTSGVSPEDIARRLGVSRRLLDLRFTQLQGATVSSAIRQERLALLRSMLTERPGTIEGLSISCGFRNPNSAKRMFREAFGITMKDFRRRAHATAATAASPRSAAPRSQAWP